MRPMMRAMAVAGALTAASLLGASPAGAQVYHRTVTVSGHYHQPQAVYYTQPQVVYSTPPPVVYYTPPQPVYYAPYQAVYYTPYQPHYHVRWHTHDDDDDD